MSRRNVHKGGMNIDRMLAQLSDREVDMLLDGRYPVQGHEIEALGAAIETLRSAQGGPQPQVGAELAAVFSHGLAADGSAPPEEWALPPDPGSAVHATSWRARLRTRTTRALTVLSVALGTLTGKLVIGVAVAAASFGGIHAAGVIDAPRAPDRTHEVDEVRGVRDQDRTPAPGPALEAGGPNRAGDADEAGAAGSREPSTDDVRDNPRDRGGDDVGASEPAARAAPPRDDGDQSGAETGNSAQTDEDAPGQSSKAKKPKKAKKPGNGNGTDKGKKAKNGKKAKSGQDNASEEEQ